jgi:hypothetical protein
MKYKYYLRDTKSPRNLESFLITPPPPTSFMIPYTQSFLSLLFSPLPYFSPSLPSSYFSHVLDPSLSSLPTHQLTPFLSLVTLP